MAGIGVKLSRIYNKQSILAHLAGFTYSTVVTVAPMILVIITIYIMGLLVGYSTVSYAERELFACTVLYIFIFSLLTSSPFNAVLSRFMSDTIYDEHYDDIMPCFYTGLIINVGFSSLFGIPFVIAEYFIGGVDPFFILVSLIGFASLVFVFYTMLYLSICKDYTKITVFYFAGMLLTILTGCILILIFRVQIILGMLIAVDVGFLLIGCLEYAQVRNYFQENSRNYKKVLPYFRRFWPLIVSNFFYVAGLYVHNFVFWTTPMRLVVARVFVCAEPYDMATFLALATNLTATMIFISNVELHFHDRYKKYSETVIGGRLADIEAAKKQMFRQLAAELMNLVRVQFIISVIVFLLFVVILPLFGFAGLVMQIYPCLAAGYFILFTMYGALIFLEYYNDLAGAALTSLAFFVSVLLLSIVSSHFSEIWYGLGLLAGAIIGWVVAYLRLRWVEEHIDRHIFCNGTLLKPGHGERPSSRVFVKKGIQ